MKHIYACDCGAHREVLASKLTLGRAVQCHSCKKVCARVESRGQGTCWITIDPKEVEFHDILGHRYDALDEDDVDQQITKEG